MNKDDVVVTLARRTGMMRVNAEVAVDTVFQIISEALADGEKVQIIGFGTFEPRERAPRTGRNPKTNTPVPIPAKRVSFFKPGKPLKKMVEK